MLSNKQINGIRESLEQSQNPLFFFDNDVDGLCSFLILQRALGRGKGVPIKSFPDLNKSYIRKINELNPDAVFILDKALVSKEFIEETLKKNLPITWIDHHEVQFDREIIENISYYNTFPSAEPTTYVAQKVFSRNEDLWLAMIGCIGDVYMPDFAEKFSEQFPELLPNSEIEAFDALQSTGLGKLVRMLNFGLMDTITNAINLIKYLMKAKSPQDVLEENQKTKDFHKRFAQLNEFYNKQIQKAEAQFDETKKVLFFTYSGNTSMSSEISNRLFFSHKDKFVVVGYKSSEKVNLSIRGKNAKQITLKAIDNIDGAKGGGHEEATGAQIPTDSLDEFRKKIEELVE